MSILNAITAGAGGVALTGDTTGNLVIQSAGTNVATFTTGGSLLNANGRPMLNQTGGILQVVSSTAGGSGAITSTSLVSTSLTATITPSSTSSKIFVMVSGLGSITGTSNYMYFTLYRNGSNIGTGAQPYFSDVSALNGYDAAMGFNYLDSPASTSALTYTVYTKVSAGTGYLGDGTITNTITLMEVSG
jgi:hypothetical protein